MADAAAREAVHGTTILKQVTTELTERMQATLIEASLLRDGGMVAAITGRELRANTHAQLCALAAVLAARGFACMAGGSLILFLAANDSMVEGEVIKMPRSLGNGVHGLESQQPARWGRFRRFGDDQKVPTTSELVEAVKKERAKNVAKGRACAQPNPSPSQKPNLTHLQMCAICVMCLRRQEGQGGIKEAHANFKNGMATEREKAMVARANTAKGTNPGYVVMDQNGHKQNARIHFRAAGSCYFNISVGRGNTYMYSHPRSLDPGVRLLFLL
jgi:hypothetical protein